MRRRALIFLLAAAVLSAPLAALAENSAMDQTEEAELTLAEENDTEQELVEVAQGKPTGYCDWVVGESGYIVDNDESTQGGFYYRKTTGTI